MGTVAVSWEVKTTSPERVAASFAQAVAQVKKPAGGLVFASGALAEDPEAIVRAIAILGLNVPVTAVAAAGVLTERGELEDQSAASGVVWAGGRTEIVEIVSADGADVGESLARVLADRTSKTAPTVLLFLQPNGFGPSTLEPLRDLRSTPHVFGAGTVGDPGASGLDASGNIVSGSVAMILRGVPPPVVRTAHSCRLLGPLRPITAVRGALLVEIDGEPALDVLAAHGESLADRPLLLMVLADEVDSRSSESGRPALVVRGIQGVDPDRRAIVVSDEVREGMRVAFAVRDGRAAREDFEAMSRELEREIAGAAPRFGVYLNCAGRGSGLYGAHDVDAKILRARFPGVPFAGMASSFEIAPHFGRPTMQLYTGVFALFTSPS
ncbi:MAG TPA: FIST C-terminal domain-containing protein [Polyangiaceae bacterium]|jgi:small ligand-binding sensory domain FIST|nr:FIST C-terminal domain-containing protein [Polyangiaceae bacterium]